MRKCIYCKCCISEEFPVDVCKRCGIGVWGERMFNAIVLGMDKEKQKGNMELGRVGYKESEDLRKNESMPEKFAEKEIISASDETKRVNRTDMPLKSASIGESIEIGKSQNQEIENSIDKDALEQFSDVEIDTFYLN